MILCLLDFLSFFLYFASVLVVFGINVMLSWKSLFLSALKYIEIDSLKTTLLDEIFEVLLAIALVISLIIAGEWFEFLLMYTGTLSGFYMVDMCLPVYKFILRLRKLTILRLVCIAMFKPHSLNSLNMAIIFLSISGPDKFLTIAKASSLCKSTRPLWRKVHNKFSI